MQLELYIPRKRFILIPKLQSWQGKRECNEANQEITFRPDLYFNKPIFSGVHIQCERPANCDASTVHQYLRTAYSHCHSGRYICPALANSDVGRHSAGNAIHA